MNQDTYLFAKSQEPVEAEKEKHEQLADRLKTIIRTVSGRPEIEVTTKVDPQIAFQMARQGKDAEQVWFHTRQYDRVSKKKVKEFIHVPAKIIESTEGVAKGKAAHEAGHAAITRFGEFIPDEVMQELGFHSLIAAIEELPTDQVVRERYEGAGSWVDEARADSVSDASFAAESEKKSSGIPKFGQFCDLVVYAKHFKTIPSHYDQDVVDLYEKHEKTIREIEKMLPAEGSTEEEVVKKAQERYKHTYGKIWQDVKKLVKEDVERQKAEEMVRKAGEGEGSLESGEGGNMERQLRKALEEMPEELKKEMQKMLEDLKKQIEEKIQSSEKEKEGNQAQDNLEKDAEGLKQDEKGDEQEESVSETKQEEAPQGPLKMSKKLQAKLKEIYDKLPQDAKKEIETAAKKALEEIEDLVVEKMQGGLEDSPAETHKENEEREKTEAAERSETESMKDLEKKIAALQESSSVYDETYKEIQAFDRELYQELEALFVPNLKSRSSLRSTGSKLNLNAVFRWEADKGAGAPVVNTKIFETIKNPEKRDYVITILVDLSGSMSGGTIEETFKGVVLLTEVLNRLGIKNEILGFQDELIVFKEFGDILDDSVRKKISGMIGEVYGRNPGGHNFPSNNDDGPCLEEASRRLAEYSGKEKIIIVLSDGQPAGRRSNAGDLIRVIRNILKQGDQKLIGVGLGEDTEHVKKFYPVSLPNIRTKDLAKTLGGLLKDLIENPRKYDQSI